MTFAECYISFMVCFYLTLHMFCSLSWFFYLSSCQEQFLKEQWNFTRCAYRSLLLCILLLIFLACCAFFRKYNVISKSIIPAILELYISSFIEDGKFGLASYCTSTCNIKHFLVAEKFISSERVTCFLLPNLFKFIFVIKVL